MFVSKLESLQKSESLINISTNGEIIDSDLSQLARGVNQEQASECQTFIFLQDSICFADCHILISQQRNLNDHSYKKTFNHEINLF